MITSAIVYPTIPASDMDRAQAFWVDQLGFSIIETAPDGSVILEAAGGTRLCLYPSSFAGSNKATACAFEVDNITEEVEQLKSRGVQFEEYDFPGLKTADGIATMGEAQAAWFTDTEGNIIGVFSPARVPA
jgi:predicted enzyme related to lactoylglutathione lyase